jgi:hypothetical protein
LHEHVEQLLIINTGVGRSVFAKRLLSVGDSKPEQRAVNDAADCGVR